MRLCIVIKILILGSFCSGVNCIIGGRFAKPAEFPYQVQLFFEDQFFCGGVIISQYAVMTNSHCFGPLIEDVRMKNWDWQQTIKKLHVVAGTNKLCTNKEFNSFRKKGARMSLQIRNIVKLEFSPRYADDNFTRVEHDFAVLFLKFPLEYNNRVKNIPLPKHRIKIADLSKTVSMAGWGATDLQIVRSSKLKIIHGKISTKCWKDPKKEVHKNSLKYVSIDTGEKGRTLCVERKRGEHIFLGDSGGPISCYYKTDTLRRFPFLCGLITTTSKIANESMINKADTFSYHMKLNLKENLEDLERFVDKLNFRMKCNIHSFYLPKSGYPCFPKEYICKNEGPLTNVQQIFMPDADHFYKPTSSSKCRDFDPCGRNQFRCLNGKCVDIEYVCDGEKDCYDIPSHDSSDEDKCPNWEDAELCKGDSLFYCGPGDRCISTEWICDGFADCLTNESDEDIRSTSCFSFRLNYYFFLSQPRICTVKMRT